MAHNIRLRDIFVAKAIKRVRNLFTKWPISILFFFDASVNGCYVHKIFPFVIFTLFFALVAYMDGLMIMVAGPVVSINYKSRMQYGSVKGVENMIFNKKG